MNVPKSDERPIITNYLAHKAVCLNLPLSGTFELSPVCNFSCKMCYVRKTREEVQSSQRNILRLDDWRRLAREAKDAGTLYILLTGGEPLLWPDFWTLYEELIEMGFLISINTNAAMIDEAVVVRFQKLPPYRINVTLYGASNETYKRLCGVENVFSAVDNAISKLLENHINVKINCSLTPENEKDLDWIIDYAKDKNTKLTVATYMFPPVRRDETQIGMNQRFEPEESARNTLRYLERYRGGEGYQQYLQSIVDGCVEPPGLEEGCVDPLDGKIRCRAGRSSFWITWDGWMTPCGMMPEPKTDVKDKTFEKAWRSVVEMTDQIRLSGVCNACPNINVCHPCAAIAFAETGKTSEIPTYMCKVSQEMRRIACDTLHIENTK